MRAKLGFGGAPTSHSSWRPVPSTEPARLNPLPLAQQLRIRGLAGGQGVVRLLPSGDVEVRISTSEGRFEYLVTPSGETTLTRSLPPSRTLRLLEAPGMLAAVIAAAGFVFVPVYGVLYQVRVAPHQGRWALPVIFAAWCLVLLYLGLEDWLKSRDSFMRPDRGHDGYRLDKSLPEGKWTALAKSVRVGDGGEDGGGDGDGD